MTCNNINDDDLEIALQKSRQLMALLPLVLNKTAANDAALASIAEELATDVHYAVRRIR